MKQFLASLFCLSLVAACASEGASAEATALDAPGPAGPAGPAASAGPRPPSARAKPAVLRSSATPATLHAAHADALDWLAAQQAEDGSWSGPDTSGVNQVGLTGLSLLALQSDGSTMSTGHSAKSIARGVKWLMSQQKSDTGLIGERIGHGFCYDHAIATQALCIALKNSPSDSLRDAAQGGVNFIAMARNPYGAWRYNVPPTGENDTSVTGWMVEALSAAKNAGLKIDEQALVGARQWIDEVTDPKTARVGYDSIGSMSSRVTGLNDQFSTEHHEAMTASGMVTRMNTGETAGASSILNKHAELLRKRLPEWDADRKLIDEYYWYFGSLAMRRLGGKDWESWSAALEPALLGSQNAGGGAKGSWEPAGPWAFAGGAVYATSLNALSLATML